MPRPTFDRRTATLAVLACFAAIAVAAYGLWDLIIVHQVLKTDFGAHLRRVHALLQTDSYILSGHFLFQTLTAGVAASLDVAPERAAVLVMVASTVASAAVIYGLYLAPPAKRQDLPLRLALAISALIATAIFLPFFNRIYSGQSSPNVWHNPTNVLLKPFALLGAIYLERILFKKPGTWTYVAFVAAAVTGLAAKPAFVLLLIPVLAAAVVVANLPPRLRMLPRDYLALDRSTCLVLLGIALGLLALLVIQGIYIFTVVQHESHVVVAPFAVWSRTSPFIPLSLLLAVAFPAAVTWLDWKKGVRLEGLALAWAFVGVALCIRSLFAEAGPAMMHGNFGWPYQIALSVLFAFSVRSYYRHAVAAEKGAGFGIATALLFAHVVSGCYYLYQVLVLGRYL